MALMTSIRNRMHVVLWGLLIIFLLSMTVGGLVGGADIIDQLFGRVSPSSAIGTVNGEIISPEFFSRLVSNRIDQARANGQTIDDRTLDQTRKQVWDNIVRDFLVAQKVEELEIEASNDEVIYHLKNNPPAFLKSNPQFQTLGEFDQTKYDVAISNPEGNEWAPIEQFMKNTFIPDYKLRQILFSSISATQDEIREEFIKRNVEYTIEALHVTNSMIDSDSLKPSDEQLIAEYNSRLDEFEIGETRSIRYVAWEKVPTASDSATVKSEASELKSRITQGEDFSELANLYTQDLSNQVNPDSGKGGDLGFISKGQMVPAFEQAAFNAKPNTIVGPILSAFGYHIIKVFEIKNESDNEKVHVAHILLKITPSPATLDELKRKSVLFSYDAQDYGFDSAVDSHSVEIKSSNGLTEDANYVPGLGFMRSAIRFAYNNKPGFVSDPLENENYFIVTTLDSIIPPGHKPYEDVKSRISRDLTNQINKNETEKIAQLLMGEINGGSTMKALKSEHEGLERVDSDTKTLNRSFNSIGKSNFVTGALLKSSPGDIVGPVKTSRGFAIVHLMDVSEIDSSQFEIQNDGIRNSLLNQKRNRAFNEWLDHQKSNAEIVDNRNYFF